MLNDNEFIEKILKIESPFALLDAVFGDENGIRFWSLDQEYRDICAAFESAAAQILIERKRVNGYQEPWITSTVHINKKAGEIHCDGSSEAVQIIKEKMHANGKVHDTLHSVDALDNLSMVSVKGTEQDLLEYVRVLLAEWALKRSDLVNTLCAVCGKSGHLDAKLIHDACLKNISKILIMLPGTIVMLKCDLLGNNTGAFGVCYDAYQLGNHQGSSFIFENGEYDGFSPVEQEEMLKLVGQSADVKDYKFTNVIQLTADFSAVDSPFKKALEFAKTIRS